MGILCHIMVIPISRIAPKRISLTIFLLLVVVLIVRM